MKQEKFPAFQFYPGDWHKDPGVRCLNMEERGIWFEILLLMFESESRGRFSLNGKPYPVDLFSNSINLPLPKVQQTLSKFLAIGVASIDENTGVMFNRRMIRDEELRRIRREVGALGGKQKAINASSKRLANPTPSVSSSVSSSEKSKSEPYAESQENLGSPPAKNDIWPEEDKWLPEYLKKIQEEGYPIDLSPLYHHSWWDATSVVLNGVSKELIREQFGRMKVWLIENASRKPTARGTKRFVRSWLERAKSNNRRNYAKRAEYSIL